MNAGAMTLAEIRVAGLRALSRELGAVGLVRFLQQFETGYGDYTVDRHKWLDKDPVETIVRDIRERRTTNPT
jgi:hypothetical protein